MEDLQGIGSTTSHSTVPPTFHSASGLSSEAAYVAAAWSPAISPLSPAGGLGSRNSGGAALAMQARRTGKCWCR